ncbi:hypothetical protein OI25_7523 [Paraburkholderia fungorum]|uniref:Uncharacterized protein n=1 Tax=Paraburkholderia fungorum TaxID=134537 RepID=A0AAU8SVV2_9BURK|nr:hypothetical protein OI25_7523 [Paraburkholderia fungorum]
MLPSALIAEPLRHQSGTMNGLQRRVALKAMHEHGRDRRRYYSYFENALTFTSSDGHRQRVTQRGDQAACHAHVRAGVAVARVQLHVSEAVEIASVQGEVLAGQASVHGCS